jgi:hypothetical protein
VSDNSPRIALSARHWVTKLAALNVPFDAKALMSASGCSSSTAQTVLSKTASEGVIERVAHGWFAKPGVIPRHKPRKGGDEFTALARAEGEAKERYLADVDAWLRDKTQFPGATSPLPLASARQASFNERGSRRRG